MDKSGSALDLDDDNVVSRVSPWKNKGEFNMVYDWLFGGGGNNIETKQLALSRMKLWKMRRGQLTPASVLSTISILDVQLKDLCDDRFSDDELRSMYANAFTRFVNYMSSIMRSRTVQSMYSTARELGMEPFLIDLRHLCAHGQVLPSLELSRRTTDYCIRWLREFYWDRERNFIVDACVRDVRLKSSLNLEQSIAEWFALYDAATEALTAGFKNVDDLTSMEPADSTQLRLSSANVQRLKEFSLEIRQYKLSFIANKAINELAWLSNSNDRDRGDAQIYCDVLLNDCEYFIKRSAEFYRIARCDNQTIKFIGIHQNLFRMFAICGFINSIFLRFVHLCEDDLANEDEKCMASFWAQEIATGFLVFKEFKILYKRKRENSSKFDMDMAPINTDFMTDDIRKMYKELGVNYRGTLIFGDTIRRPWSLQFDRDFLYERVININEYTIDIVKKCIQLIEPALTDTDAQHIERLIAIYMDQDSTKSNISEENSKLSGEDDKIYTLNECLHTNSRVATEPCSDISMNSIWREPLDGIDWKLCPIGGSLTC